MTALKGNVGGLLLEWYILQSLCNSIAISLPFGNLRRVGAYFSYNKEETIIIESNVSMERSL